MPGLFGYSDQNDLSRNGFVQKNAGADDLQERVQI